MKKDWKTYRLGDIAKKIAMGPFGSNIKVATFQAEGVPVISGQHLHGIHLKDCDYNFISYEHAERLKSANVGRQDVIFTHAGTLGQVAYIPDDSEYQRYIISQRQFYLRCDETVLDYKFITYYFRSPYGKYQLLSNSSQTGVPSLAQPVTFLKNLQVFLPPLAEQRKIAEALFSLDDKIDLLHRQNKTLEAMAETLFRQWFIEEAKEDWEEGTLADVVDNVKEAVKVSAIKPDCKYVGLEHIGRKNIALSQTGLGAEVSSNKYLFKKNDILFGKLRPYFHKVCFAPFDGICSTDVLVIRPKRPELFAFCLFAFFQSQVVDFANLGSGGTRMPRTDWGTLKRFPMSSPPCEVLWRFNSIVLPSVDKILGNLEQIKTLEILRDNLLPKLINGEIRMEV